MPRTKKINIGKRIIPNEKKGLSKYQGRGKKTMKTFVEGKIDNSEEIDDEQTVFESQVEVRDTLSNSEVEALIQKQIQEKLEEKLRLINEQKNKEREEKIRAKEEAKKLKELEKQERLRKKEEERITKQKIKEEEEAKRIENEKQLYLKYIEDTIYKRDRSVLVQKINEVTEQRNTKIGAKIRI